MSQTTQIPRTPQETYAMFRDFYENPFLDNIRHKERWTVSDNTKCPIDMFCYQYQGRITGAQVQESPSLVSLDRVVSLLPGARNNAYFLDALEDRLVVLDIEPVCPDDIKQKLLQLPYLYAETSMSGNGIHLVFPLPDCIDEYPEAKQKIVFKEEHKYYEVLLHHYVTFTRNALPTNDNPSGSFEDLFRDLASKQKSSIANDIRLDIDLENIDDIDVPHKEQVLYYLSGQPKYKKTPQDFSGDMSQYEFNHIRYLYFKLHKITKVNSVNTDGHVYSDDEKAVLLYPVVKDRIPYREKHETNRQGMPWLLYLIKDVIAKTDPTKTQTRK